MFRRWLTGLFRPLEINTAFEARSYRFGDTVELTVELGAKRDVEITEGRVDLVCEERYAETYTRMYEPRHAPGLITRRGRRQIDAPAPRQVVQEHVNLFVHSSAVFLEDTELHSGAASSFKLRLEIQQDRPPHAGGGTLTWALTTKVRDIFDREFTDTREIEITLK